MARINDRSLAELISRSTQGEWAVGSNESYQFFIYDKQADNIRYILKDIPENTSNYDIRLMSLARELALEVLKYRAEDYQRNQP